MSPQHSAHAKRSKNTSNAECTAPVILVTGSREWDDQKLVEHVLHKWLRERYPTRPSGPRLPVLRHGGARGLDTIAGGLWTSWGLPTDRVRADWSTCSELCDGTGKCRITVPAGEYCVNAGKARNCEMVDTQPYPEVCFAFLKDQSGGAMHCADYAEERGIPVRRYTA